MTSIRTRMIQKHADGLTAQRQKSQTTDSILFQTRRSILGSDGLTIERPEPGWMKINRQTWTGRMFELTLAFLELLSELKKPFIKGIPKCRL